ncbi:hypothetical protein BGZ76_006501 [Entomortierella beljakovae]|nr:hypothetical protein BGZ76_006501 [Entomortierella beljakovae]
MSINESAILNIASYSPHSVENISSQKTTYLTDVQIAELQASKVTSSTDGYLNSEPQSKDLFTDMESYITPKTKKSKKIAI